MIVRACVMSSKLSDNFSFRNANEKWIEMGHRHLQRVSGSCSCLFFLLHKLHCTAWLAGTSQTPDMVAVYHIIATAIDCVLGSPNANVPSRDLVQEGTCSVERNLLSKAKGKLKPCSAASQNLGDVKLFTGVGWIWWMISWMVASALLPLTVSQIEPASLHVHDTWKW